MSKLGVIFIISLILFGFLAITLVMAEDVPGIPPALNKDPNELIEQTKNKTLTSTEYLKQEWKTLLFQNPTISPIVKLIDNVLTTLNPFFKAVLGVEYSISWAFIFAVMFWLILFFILYPLAYPLVNNNLLFALLVSFAITSLIGLSGVIRRAVDILSTMLTQKWLVVLSLAVTLLILAVAIIFKRGLKKVFQKEKEKETKEKEKQNREILDIAAKVAKKELEDAQDDARRNADYDT